MCVLSLEEVNTPRHEDRRVNSGVMPICFEYLPTHNIANYVYASHKFCLEFIHFSGKRI